MKNRKLTCITEIPSFKDTPVLVRASLNVPLEGGRVVNQFRIVRALPTLMHLIQKGARIILMAHIGRDPKETLYPVYTVLKNHFPVSFVEDVTGPKVEKAIDALQSGEILLLENLRSEAGEIENSDAFAKKLSTYADLYVNDAFPVSHRMHASIVGVPKYLPGFMGFTFREEYNELSNLTKPKSPALFILGGAKFETKVPLVQKFIGVYDHIFIGGALANDFFKARGYEVGKSLVSKAKHTDIKKFDHQGKILLPIDVVVQHARTKEVRVTVPTDIKKQEVIRDVGPETILMLSGYTHSAKTILWNGPLGNYEAGFVDQTVACAKLVARSGARTTVGGGDTIAAIESQGLNQSFSFLSSAGGAMLSFLEAGTLPGIEALKKSKERNT